MTIAVALTLAPQAHAATLFDPALRFRMLPTAHFVIYFHQGDDRLAQRLAAIAEDTWRALERPLGVTPPPLTHVVLADQTESANGYATPLPYDTIVIYPVWPSGSEFDFDDWLRLVFTHEFTHIIHLDRSEGWARVVRSVFGRMALGFPNIFLPIWQIEGLATYEESIITGEGRLHAGDFRAIVDEAARQHALEPLDRVNGGLTDWPGGVAAYAYGVGFHQYLVDRFGAERLAALADATARSIPYTGSRAFGRIYGTSLATLWREYEASLRGNVGPLPTAEGTASRPSPTDADAPSPTDARDQKITRLTHQGFQVSGPRFDRFACTGCPADVLYSAINPNGFPSLYRVALDGSEPHPVTTRYFGSTTAIGREAVYFDQMEVRRNTGVYSDLYEWSRRTGRVRELTREARLFDPDLSPDGQTLVCVQNRPGQRDLVMVRLPAPRSLEWKPDTTSGALAYGALAIDTLVAEADSHFNAPKWSPDGRTIAVERHRLGAMPEIVLVDVATKTTRVLATDAHTRFTTPAWRPDGEAVVSAAAPADQTFNLVELAVDGSGTRQLTHTAGGATWPDVSPDGQRIVFVGYTTDGDDIFSMPYPRATSGSAARVPTAPDTRAGDTRVAPYDNAQARPTADYSPLGTLKPTSWSPIIETASEQVRVGAAVAGYDVLGYHAYAASATWLVSGPAGAPRPSAASPDWQVYYTYDRWRPRVYVSASSATSFFAGPATDAGTPTAATLRERLIEGGVVFPIRHGRALHAGLLSITRAVDDYTLPDRIVSRDRTPIRAAWETATAKTYGYSISREDGIAVGVTAELVRQALGSSADATTLTGDVRANLRGLAPHHVIAVRVAGGASTGDPTVGRTFLLGGAFPGNDVVNFGSSAFSLLRGFTPDTFAGSHVALTNVEYRWPIARPQRGIRAWPIFLHTIHAAAFADVGHAWTQTFRADAIKTSVGGELAANIVAGYVLPLTATVGAAWGHDGSGTLADRVTLYFRVGKSF